VSLFEITDGQSSYTLEKNKNGHVHEREISSERNDEGQAGVSGGRPAPQEAAPRTPAARRARARARVPGSTGPACVRFPTPDVWPELRRRHALARAPPAPARC